jgi:hypothetical protein
MTRPQMPAVVSGNQPLSLETDDSDAGYDSVHSRSASPMRIWLCTGSRTPTPPEAVPKLTDILSPPITTWCPNPPTNGAGFPAA